MYIKYNYALTSLDYILAFDLALYKTGVSLYDIKNQKIIQNKYTNANIARKRTIFIEFGVMYVIIF